MHTFVSGQILLGPYSESGTLWLLQYINTSTTKDFIYLHTPIITGSDAEGAGEMFHVTTLDLIKFTT